LPYLASHRTLRCLRLSFIEYRWLHSLDNLIVATRRLQVLHLEDFFFAQDNMQQLVNALVANRSVTTLQLFDCTLDTDASNMFIKFVQTQCNQHGPNGNCIRKLHLTVCSFDGLDRSVAVARMLSGSRLKVLRLDGNCSFRFETKTVNYVKFYKVLSANASQIHLPCLILGGLDRTDLKRALKYLATSLHLRTLVVTMGSWVHSRAVCRALFRCASLRQVKLTSEQHRTDTLSEQERHMVNAACDRNKNLPRMLVADHSELALFPSLFLAARQAPRTTLNNMLIGLVTLGRHKNSRFGSAWRCKTIPSGKISSVASCIALTGGFAGDDCLLR
jgi:hypothetical protein